MKTEHIKPYSYIILKEGNVWVARDENGIVVFGGSDDIGGKDGAAPGEVIKGAVDAMGVETYIQKIVLKGEF